jgi:hypothetical protein
MIGLKVEENWPQIDVVSDTDTTLFRKAVDALEGAFDKYTKNHQKKPEDDHYDSAQPPNINVNVNINVSINVNININQSANDVNVVKHPQEEGKGSNAAPEAPKPSKFLSEHSGLDVTEHKVEKLNLLGLRDEKELEKIGITKIQDLRKMRTAAKDLATELQIPKKVRIGVRVGPKGDESERVNSSANIPKVYKDKAVYECTKIDMHDLHSVDPREFDLIYDVMPDQVFSLEERLVMSCLLWQLCLHWLG